MPKLFFQVTLLAVSVSLLFAPQLQAIDLDDYFAMSLEELLMVEVVTASKRSQTINKAPAMVYVISAEDINHRGYSILSDVLRDLPGFDTTEYGGAEFGTDISVRGVPGNNKVILLYDNVRVNSPGGEPMQIRGDISVRHAERIEIVYGPGSTLYGQDAINAVINVVTKTGDSHRASEVSIAFGEHAYKDAFVSYANATTLKNGNTLQLSTYFQWQDSELSDLKEDYPQWWQTLYEGSIAGDLGGDPIQRWDEGLNFNLNLETQENAVRVWYRESSRSCAGGAAQTLVYSDGCIWTDKSLVIDASNQVHFSENVSLHSTINYRRSEVDPESRYLNLAGNGQFSFSNRKYGLATGIKVEERFDIVISDALFFKVGVVLKDHSTLVKATIPEQGFDVNGNAIQQIGEYSYYTEAGDANSLVVKASGTELHYQTSAVYLELDYAINDALGLVLGLRKDYDERIDQRPFSPRAAAIYHFNDHLTLKYIYTEAFTAAAPYFAYVNFITPSVIVDNTDALEAEEALSHEINISWTEQYWLTGISLYHNEQKNLIHVANAGFDFNIADSDVYLDEAGTQQRVLLQAANGGDSVSEGVDIYTRYQWQAVDLWASLSYVDYEANIEGDKRGLERLSSKNVRLGATWQPMPAMQVTPSLVYRSTPENISVFNGLEDETDNPYWLNLYLSYHPASNVKTYLRIDNMTDNRIALRGLSGPAPQESRSIRLGITYQY